MAQREDYRRAFYGSYASTHAGVGPTGRAAGLVLAGMAAFLPRDRDARILDIGCGQGEVVRALGERGYRNALGIDASREQVEIAHARGLDNVRHAELEGFLREYEDQFDAIVAYDVLEHLEKPELLEALALVRAALGPGGVLIARVPNAVSPFGGRYRYGDFTHALSFTPRSVRQIAAVTGLVDVHVRPAEPVAHGPASAARRILWKGIATVWKAMLLVETGEARGHVVTQNLVFSARKPASPRPAGGEPLSR